MFRSRRQLAAAAGFWVLSVAAFAGISSIPGASAAAPTPVFRDGFESGNLSQWTKSNGMTVQRQLTYAGSWAARATSSGTPAYAYKRLSTPLSELYYAGRFQAISQGASNASLVRFRTASAGLIFSIFRRGSDGKLAYYNEVTRASTVGPVITAGAWHDLEVHVRINGTSSLIEVWLDGTRFVSKTDSLGTTQVGRIYLGDPGRGRTFDFAFDDELVSMSDTTPPSTPTGLAVSAASGTSIPLGWKASSDNVGVVGYDVSVNGSSIGATNGTSYTFSSLSCGTSYTLGVDAFDAARNTSAKATVIASTATCSASGQQPADITPPTTPTGVTVNGATQSSIAVGWNASADNVGVAGYNVYRNDSRVGTTTNTSYAFSGLACGTSYKLGVDAFDAAGGISARVSITATSSPCSWQVSPTELIFPGFTGAPGTTLPERGCSDPSPSANCAQEGGFNRSDYEGMASLNGVNERMRWVGDPSGSGKTVMQWDVYGDDSADAYGGTRTSLYKNDSNPNGTDGYQVWGFYFPVGFQYPDQWFALMQNFISPKPVQTIELRSSCGGVTSSQRDIICWGYHETSGDPFIYSSLGKVSEGHWIYIVAQISFRNTATGSFKVWRSDDVLPNVSVGAPLSQKSGILTLWAGAASSRSNIFMYRGASSHAQHQVSYVCGFHQAGTAAAAMTLPNCPT